MRIKTHPQDFVSGGLAQREFEEDIALNRQCHWRTLLDGEPAVGRAGSNQRLDVGYCSGRYNITIKIYCHNNRGTKYSSSLTGSITLIVASSHSRSWVPCISKTLLVGLACPSPLHSGHAFATNAWTFKQSLITTRICACTRSQLGL